MCYVNLKELWYLVGGGSVLEGRLELLSDDKGACHLVNIGILNGQVHLYVVHMLADPQVINMLEYFLGEGDCNDGEQFHVDSEPEVGVDSGNYNVQVNVDAEYEVVIERMGHDEGEDEVVVEFEGEGEGEGEGDVGVEKEGEGEGEDDVMEVEAQDDVADFEKGEDDVGVEGEGEGHNDIDVEGEGEGHDEGHDESDVST
ncbi:spore wall protein 2-like [Vigna umbellata]|uniref:spore wall protein 2-like n=1 Tax=Vigna umbellata TaxID=87088 RepID=UPI001F5EB3E0|nr:spore wall protein 2-like [Vigna umbellata]